MRTFVLPAVIAGTACAIAPSPHTGHYGPLATNGGVSFRVWAPHASAITLRGTFNGWNATSDPLAPDDASSNYWSGFFTAPQQGDEYKFYVNNAFYRPDPWARQLGANDNGVLVDASFPWTPFARPDESQAVVYELHVGTFNSGTFGGVAARAAYLRQLGVNAVELMPPAEFNGSQSWGYNPVATYALEAAYGGYAAFKSMVETLHQHGIAVYVDLVHNHIEGTVLWQWDGWSMGGHACAIDAGTYQHGGIFYYGWTGSPPERWHTPWGHNRPDFSRPEVTNYLAGNIAFWLREMNCDGIRVDSTINMRTVNNGAGGDITEGYTLLRLCNALADAVAPGSIMIAEDLSNYSGVTDKSGGAFTLGFDSQWNDYFVDNVRAQMKFSQDNQRTMAVLQNAVQSTENGRAFATVKYSDSHDDAANGQQRLNVEIDPPGTSYHAKKRSTLAAALALTAPGIPMILQGQEFLEDGYFSDSDPLDWTKVNAHGGIWRLYHDLIHARRNAYGITSGLTGAYVNAYFVDDANKLMAYHRRSTGGAGDDVIVIVNNSAAARHGVAIGMPSSGAWNAVCNSDWRCYDPGFGGMGRQTVVATAGPLHGMAAQAVVDAPPYSFVIYSQGAPPAPVAAFTASPTNGAQGLLVRFHDDTAGIATNWLWEFGDGQTSMVVNPSHSYSHGGVYTVSMSVSGPGGASAVAQTGMVTVVEGNWLDGQNITGDFADAENAVYQDTATDWGSWNSLLSMRGTLTGDRVLLGIAGSIEKNNGLAVFFDTDMARGTNVIPAGLSGVATRATNMAGLVFDTQFTPERVLTIGVRNDAAPALAWVDWSDLGNNSYEYLGTLENLDTGYGSISNGQAQIALFDQAAAGAGLAATNTFATGLECAISLAALGGSSDMCWVQALIINNDGTYSANQSLGPAHGSAGGAGGLTKNKRYDLAPGEQFMVLGIPEPLLILPVLFIIACRFIPPAALTRVPSPRIQGGTSRLP